MVRVWRSFQDSLIQESHKLWYQNPLVKPTCATVRFKECKNIRVDKIMKFRIFKQVLHKEVMSPLPESFMGMSIMPGWETFPYLVLVKPNQLMKS